MRIFLILTLLISIQSFGQDSYRGDSKIGERIYYRSFYGVPTNYQYRTVRERLIAFMIDSSLHIPRYCGTPSGLRVGSSTNDGALAVDTCNNLLYFYSGGAWISVTSTNIYNSNGILDGNRTLTGLNNTYSLNFDSLNSFRVQRNGVTRILMNSTATEITSPNTTATIYVNNSNALMSYGSNAFRVMADSATSTKKIVYETNINGSLTTPNSLITKSFADSVYGGGGGTINSGTTGKPAYYVGATTLDDFAPIDYATSGTNMLLTTQNTTDVGLNIKGVSSQTANLLNISSSAGTGDLAFINSSGEMIFGGNTDAGVYDLQINDGLWVNNVSSSAGNGLVLSPSTTISSAFVIQNNSGGEWIMAALNATSLKMFTSSSPIYISPGGTDKAVFLSGGGMTMPEGSAPGTPAANHSVVYPKSDGLWYGKDDAGVETQLSNAAGATPTLQQVFDTEVGGSVFTKDDTVQLSGFNWRIIGNSGTIYRFNSNGFFGATNTGAVTAITGTSGSSLAFSGSTTSSTGSAFFNANPSSTNTVIPVLVLERSSSGTAAEGIGQSIQFQTERANGSATNSNFITSKWMDASVAYTSQYGVVGVNNTVYDTLTTLGGYVNLTESSATQFTTTTIATGKIQGGQIVLTIEANDATDYQARTLRFIWSAVNKAGTLTITISTPEEVVAVSSGTLTATITGVDNGSGVLSFKANAVSSLTQSTLRATYQTFKNF